MSWDFPTHNLCFIASKEPHLHGPWFSPFWCAPTLLSPLRETPAKSKENLKPGTPSSTARELANTPVDPTVPYAVHLKQKVQVLQKVSMQHDATFVHCSRFKNFTWSKPLPGWPLNGVANKLHSHRLKLPLWWYSLCQTPFTGPIVENMAQQILQQKDLEQT